MSDPLRILTVCTHNRTRSVLIAGLLHAELTSCGVAAVMSTAGFGEPGQTADPQAVAALAIRGIDAHGHSSQMLSAELVDAADLVLTADRIHVVRVAEDRLDLFSRTFTLPELVERAEAYGPRRETDLGTWLAELSVGRTPASYLTDWVPEVEDPTGLPHDVFRGVVAQIEQWCRRVAVMM